MIYLALQISIYLLAALALGVAAGWLWRHRDAAAEQQALERRLIDSGHRLPSMEAALRDRDARIAGLEQSLAERNDVIDRALGERDLVLEEALAQRDAAKAELAKLLADASQSRTGSGGQRDERLARAEGRSGGAQGASAAADADPDRSPSAGSRNWVASARCRSGRSPPWSSSSSWPVSGCRARRAADSPASAGRQKKTARQGQQQRQRHRDDHHGSDREVERRTRALDADVAGQPAEPAEQAALGQHAGDDQHDTGHHQPLARFHHAGTSLA
jgi:hypothetical protein